MFGNIQRDMAYANMATRQTSATGKSATTYHTGGFRQVSSLVEYQQSPNFWAQVPLQTVPSFPIGLIPTNLTNLTPGISISGDGKSIAYAYIDITTTKPVLLIYEAPNYDYKVTFTSTPIDATALVPGTYLNDSIITCKISTDGSTCVLGYIGNDDGIGAIWTYYNPGTGWQQSSPTKIIPAGLVGTRPFFGYSLALSSDNSTLVVGAPQEGYVGNPDFYPGAVFVYKLISAGVYGQFGTKLFGSNTTDIAYQGFSVSVSATGSVILFGVIYDGYTATQLLPKGCAFVFIQSSQSSSYLQDGQKLTSARLNLGFGFCCALTGDGTTAYIGAPYPDPSVAELETGVFVFNRPGELNGAQDWILQNFIGVPRSVVGTQILFGAGVGVSDDENTVAISCPTDITNPSINGSVYIFSKTGNYTYTQNGPKLCNSQYSTMFTNTIALSGDGKVLATSGYLPIVPIVKIPLGKLMALSSQEEKFKAQFDTTSVALIVYISL